MLNKNYSKRPRLPKEEYKGIKKYFITINTFNRSNFFIEREKCLLVYNCLFSVLENNNFDVILFMFMPDHIHLLIEAQDKNCDLERFMKKFKQISGFYFKKKYNKKLWSTSYYDHILRKNEYLENIIWYILNNPVRKNLVKNWYEYKFWGSTIYKKEDFY